MTVQRLGHLHRTKAVSVVLDHRENWAPTRERPQGGRIGPQRSSIDFDPRVGTAMRLSWTRSLCAESGPSRECPQTCCSGGGGQERTTGRSHGCKLRRSDR